MSLGKLKKAELQALAEANFPDFGPDCTKAELIAELEAAGISADDNSGATRESKIERQARLQARK